MKTKFNEIKESELQKLGFILPVVNRVHGRSHPEIFEVSKVFEQINSKTEQAGSEAPQLHDEFIQLRKITNNYKVPGGVCESYAAVYKILENIDKSYND